MHNLSEKLKSFSKHTSLDSIARLMLGVRTSWATGGIVVLALFCGFLFNAIQPSLLIDYSKQPESSNEHDETTPESIPDTTIKEETNLPNQQTNTNSQVDGTFTQGCNSKSLSQTLAEEDAFHKKRMDNLSGYHKFISNISGDDGQPNRESEINRHEQAVERIKRSYSNNSHGYC